MDDRACFCDSGKSFWIFKNDTAKTSEVYTLSQHAKLPFYQYFFILFISFNRGLYSKKEGGTMALQLLGLHIEELCLHILTSLCYLHIFKLSTFASPVFTPFLWSSRFFVSSHFRFIVSYFASKLTSIFGICVHTCFPVCKISQLLGNYIWAIIYGPLQKQNLDFPCLMASWLCFNAEFWHNPDDLRAK